IPEIAALPVTGRVEHRRTQVAEVEQGLHAGPGRVRRVAEVRVAQVPVRQHALVVARRILPGQIEALVGRLAGEVVDPQVFPAAVVLDAVLMRHRRVAGQVIDAHVLDLQAGVGERPARLVAAGPLTALDAVCQHAPDAVEVDPFQMHDAAALTDVALQLNPDVRSRAGPDMAANPDDVVATLDDDRIGQHHGVLQDVILARVEIHDDLTAADVAIAERDHDRVDQRWRTPAQRPAPRYRHRRWHWSLGGVRRGDRYHNAARGGGLCGGCRVVKGGGTPVQRWAGRGR